MHLFSVVTVNIQYPYALLDAEVWTQQQWISVEDSGDLYSHFKSVLEAFFLNLRIQMLKILYNDSAGVTEELDNISRGLAVNADLFWLQLSDQKSLSEGFTWEV